MGLPIDKLPGDNLKTKRHLLFQATVDKIKALLEDGGFIVKQDATRALLLPTGFLFISVSKGAVGLKWGVASDATDTERVKMQLEGLLKPFAELNSQALGHVQLLDWLVGS